jgi:hypothetical protein
MKSSNYPFFLTAGLLLLLLVGFLQTANAQVEQNGRQSTKSDTSQIKRELKQRFQGIINHYQFDRSTYKYLAPESKRYDVPSPTKFYKPPLTGQKSLDAAMKVLRKELNNSITNSRIYRILTKIAPFINNIFVFGYPNQTAPVISPWNPYLFPQTKSGQAWRNFMEKRHYSKPDK